MINFFGYHFRKLDFTLALLDILICSMGFFVYAWFGLASTGSTTPELISPIFLSIFTGFILWSLLFAVGINSVPQVGKITSFLIRALLVFLLSLPIIMPLWYISGFEHTTTPLLTIPAIFIQISILCLMRIIILKILPNNFNAENIIIIALPDEKESIKHNIQKFQQYTIKRYINILLIDRFPRFNAIAFCQKHGINKIIIGNLKNYNSLKTLVDLSYSGVNIVDIDSFKEQHVGKINLDRYYNHSALIHNKFVQPPISLFFKRLFDIIISCFLLILLMPFILITALLIKLNDGGSVLYKQKRCGKNNSVFNIYKFRSMQENAEAKGVQWAQANDARITKIGKFLRRTRIDELPQLINILKNDMSLVGPRPERPEFIQELSAHIMHYNERHRIKPGLTGWAQINVGYSDSVDGSKEKLEYDLYYLKHYNLSLDLLIVLKTISVVLWPSKVH